MAKFKEFFRSSIHNYIVREDAVPAAPENPDSDSGNKHHFSSMQRELGIDDDSFDAALAGGIIEVLKVPDYSEKWGFLVAGPCFAQVEKVNNDAYQIRFLLSQKKLMNPKSFILPYRDGEQPIIYNGPVEDKTERISTNELQDMVATAFSTMTQMTGGM